MSEALGTMKGAAAHSVSATSSRSTDFAALPTGLASFAGEDHPICKRANLLYSEIWQTCESQRSWLDAAHLSRGKVNTRT